jgi:hypothetical protein
MDVDDNGQPGWLRDFNTALQSSSIVWWGGERRLVDGQWRDLAGAYHLPCADSDYDGIPDLLDPYPYDSTNNTFSWGGGDFIVDNAWVSYSGGYSAGAYADSDGDGLPDSLDPHPYGPQQWQ